MYTPRTPSGSSQTLAQTLANGNSANSLNITNLANPVNPQDAATRAYVLANETAQTPWLSNINASGYSLTDTGVVRIGSGTDDGSGAALQVNAINAFPDYAMSVNVFGASAFGMLFSNSHNLQTNAFIIKSPSSYNYLIGADLINSGADNLFFYNQKLGTLGFMVDSSSGTPQTLVGTSSNDGTGALLQSPSMSISGLAYFGGLPASDPHVSGQMWNNLGIATISAG